MDIQEEEICICEHPLIVTDRRDGNPKTFIAVPIKILDGFVEFPEIKKVEYRGESYVRVTWLEPQTGYKEYEILKRGRHIVLAGCPESELKCDIKRLYVTYHPILEWRQYHEVELR